MDDDVAAAGAAFGTQETPRRPMTTTTKDAAAERTGARTTPTRPKRAREEEGFVWRLVTDHPNIFETHVVTKLNGNDVKFFYDVNSESRAVIKRSGVNLADVFKIGDFDTTSTISWALEKCSEEKERFCWRMALNGNLELLEFLRGKGCPWDERTCSNAALNGHLECLKYAHENGCPWDERTCSNAAKYGHLECLKYAHENGCPWDERTCSKAAKYGFNECLEYAREHGCPSDEESDLDWASEWSYDSR